MYEPRLTERKKPQPELSAEKQKLAASLFGGASSNQRASSGGAKIPKPASSLRPGEKGTPPKPTSGGSKEKASTTGPLLQATVPIPKAAPLMDLMDMGESDSSTAVVTIPTYDPFKELEGLLDPPTGTSSFAPSVPKEPSIDLMSLYTVGVDNGSDLGSLAQPSSSGIETLNVFPTGLMDANELSASPLMGLTGGVLEEASPVVSQAKKGPSRQDSLQKDAATRQVGVVPAGTNPALFQDLLG